MVWENEPIQSGELAKLCEHELGWKRTTTYTVLKKLCNRGILQNDNSIVSAPVKREQIQQYKSHAVLEKSFGGSLPQFIASFLGNKKLSAKEAQEIKSLIDRHKEE
ncbi:BlaI/MecI/CopY family transcriptional regulator [Desulfosporosinus sp. OT]|uniref:BlaI/MecI/CopY family transcriptional regulator n=1 Tax=Desulfosporosinus sp. OT TaxID=913865 RepID=UPI00068348B5|nr:BlaI/MecI/CopY family transcriptional regulator [Desulfosporosinus sp. OT]